MAYEWIDNLKPKFKSVMRDIIEGLSYDEISKKRDISMALVKSRVFRARGLLKELDDSRE